jgi:signal peptidase II
MNPTIEYSPLLTLPTRLQVALAYGLALLVVVLDFATKYIAQQSMAVGSLNPVTSFFNLVHYRNNGAAFGMLANSGGWQRWLLAAVATVVALVLVWWLTREASAWLRLGFAFMLGGAISNGTERAVYGYVTDFLDFHVARQHWPAFNVADMAICAAAALLIGNELLALKAAKKNNSPVT